MSAPKFAPTPVLDEVRTYASPPVAPDSWTNDRPGDIEGFQPSGERLGYQGPDQGYGLMLARRLAPKIHIVGDIDREDAVRGALNIGLRRASLYGRAPVVHDLVLAFTIWGFFDQNPPADLVAKRDGLFTGIGNVHHYAEGRVVADAVPEATLRLTPQQAAEAYRRDWRSACGV
jgi:hypothetical protein